jgi:hypothetical protein
LKKFEDILIQCIEDIKMGRSSIEDCLERYPAAREQLEPLLRIALAIQEPPDVKPSPGFKVRSRHQLMEQIHERQGVTRWPSFRYDNQMPQRRRFSMARMVVAIALALLALAGGTVYASQGSLPGDALYSVKLTTEQAGMMLPADAAARAERALKFAERRVEEMTALAGNGRPQDLDLAVEKYDYALNITMTRIEEAGDNGLPTGNITALVANATGKHLFVLDEVWDIVPDEAKVAIAHARNVSATGRENALAALAKNNTVRATEMNLAAMEGRLNRVRATVQNAEAVQIALQQFEAMAEFGEEISRIAQDIGLNITKVEELIAEATSIHLGVLADIWERVPEQAQPAIAQEMEKLLARHNAAVEALGQMGVDVSQLRGIPGGVRHHLEEILGEIPVAPGLPDGIPPGQS